MNWTKRRISVWTAEGSALKIVESDEAPGRPYRLDLDDQDEPLYFASLKSAQTHAGTLAELVRLRAELAQLRGDAEAPAYRAGLTSATGTPALTPAQRAAATRIRNRAAAGAATGPAVVGGLIALDDGDEGPPSDWTDGDDPGPDDGEDVPF